MAAGFISGPRRMKDGSDVLLGIEATALKIARAGESTGVLALANATECLMWPKAGTLMNDENSKDFLGFLMRTMARSMEATDFMMVSEVWVSHETGKPGERKYRRPADDPNREECMATTHETLAGVTLTHRKMVRRGGRVWLEGPMTVSSAGVTLTGRFVNILHKPAPNVHKMQGGA